MAEEDIPTELIAATEQKLIAEADAFTARAERDRAEARSFEVDAERNALNIKGDELFHMQKSIDLERDQEKRKRELAADPYFLFYAFNGQVDGASVGKCIDQLTLWMRTKPGEPIEIQFNSPGGSIVDGLALWDFLTKVKAAGHPLTTSSIGYAASMAGILLQAGDVRVMGAESWLLIHEASFGVQGSNGVVEDRVEWIKRIQARFVAILASKSKLKAKTIEQKWSRKDWWIDSDEALELGLVDEIR